MISGFPLRLAPLVAALSLLPSLSRADDSTRVGVALTGGLSGIGGDLGLNLTEYFGLRATVASFQQNRTGQYGTSANWNASLKLMQAGLLLDAYPFAGSFRLSAGVVKDGNRFNLTASPSGGNFTFNGNTYAAADIASATARVEWSKPVPYVGLGWGNLAGSSGFHFTTDFGGLITGSPSSNILVSCSAAGQSAGICAQLASDTATDQAKLQNNVHKISFWPVFRIGFGYAF